MRELTGDELLALPVRLHGIQMGQPVELLLDRQVLRAVGLDLLCGDSVHRFLPLPTAAVKVDEIAISSPLVLLEGDELNFYRSRAFTLSSLRGSPVQRKRAVEGTLRDVVVAGNGELLALIVQSDGERRRIQYDDSIRVGPKTRRAA